MSENDLDYLRNRYPFEFDEDEQWYSYHPFACGCDECWYNWDEDEDDQE